jgi:purine-binding chemotaxis protein CheW
MSELEQEYLTFMLQGEEYGVDILCVQEIRVWSDVTVLPNKPNYLKGVINLRGVIIPIILRSQGQTKPMAVGVVVDAVSEVYKFPQGSIRKAPAFGNQIDRCFLKGLVSVEDKLIILLDTQTLLNEDELYHVESNAITDLRLS